MKSCSICQSEFEVSATEKALLAKIAPEFAGKRFEIPEPKQCPCCRLQRRLAFRLERFLYRRNCDLCKRPIIAAYSPDKPFTVYCQKCWWSDRWNARDYGQEVNPSAPFFPQFLALQKHTPQIALFNSNNENSDFVNQTYNLKDCYLIYSSVDSQETFYGLRMNRDVNCLDGLVVEDSELSLDCINARGLYNCKFCQNCQDCSESLFLFDSVSCQNCLFCYNLRNKTHHIFNQPYGEKEYAAFFAEIKQECSSYERLKSLLGRFHELVEREAIHRATRVISCENSTGDHLYNSRNSQYCFQSGDLEDCAHVMLGNFAKDCGDVNNLYKCELSYQVSTGGYYNTLFCIDAWPNHRYALFTKFSPNSEHTLGCVSLQRGRYAILNREYSAEDYHRLARAILEGMCANGEWGEFFPPQCSPFGYNESVAMEFFPLDEAGAHKLGYKWCNYQTPPPKTEKTLTAAELPDNINDVSDSILECAIICEKSGRPFRLIKPELEFYRRQGIALPRHHPDVRHRARMQMVNERRLWQRPCSKCGKEVLSSIPAKKQRKMYCDECYREMI